MKSLHLTVTEKKTTYKGSPLTKYLHEIYEDGKLLAKRLAGKPYVACYISSWQTTDGQIKFEAPFYFGRYDLIGKGDSQRRGGNYYGLARVDNPTS